MSDIIYPGGLRIFPPHENAPDFVKGALIVTPRELIDFCKEKSDLLTEYQGKKQLKCQILEGNKGLYIKVDTYKSETQAAQAETQAQEEPGLPF